MALSCPHVPRGRDTGGELTDKQHNAMARTERTVDMKRLAILAVLATSMILALRKIAHMGGPAMRARCSAMCERMLNQMPESFPPNRVMADLESLKEQTAHILDMLERRTEGVGAGYATPDPQPRIPTVSPCMRDTDRRPSYPTRPGSARSNSAQPPQIDAAVRHESPVPPFLFVPFQFRC